jgi:hypothetical protein
MLVLDLTDHNPARLIGHSCRDFHDGHIVPQRLRLLEIDAVLALVLCALLGVVLKAHVGTYTKSGWYNKGIVPIQEITFLPYARSGVELERSTLADWVGQCSALLAPLVDALGSHVLNASKLHADDTPVPVLQPGRGSTKHGRLWTYVRDDRPSGGLDPPAVWFAYSPDRKGVHPRMHLKDFNGVLQADGYAGFDRLFNEADPQHPIKEAACWPHVRRKFYDIHVATQSPLALEALNRIGELYAIEEQIRGQPPDARQQTRTARAGPKLAELQAWMIQTRASLSKKSELAGAIHYALSLAGEKVLQWAVRVDTYGPQAGSIERRVVRVHLAARHADEGAVFRSQRLLHLDEALGGRAFH